MTQTFLHRLDDAPSDCVALIDDHVMITYGALRDTAMRVAAGIADRCGSKQYVIVRAEPTARFVTTLMAVMYSGNTPIPVAGDLPAGDLDFIRSKSHAALTIDQTDIQGLRSEVSCDARDSSVAALVMFTSGTTGYPKGVVLSHENILHSCRAISSYLRYDRHRSAAVVLPLHYSYALLSQVFCQLFQHGRVRLFAHLRNPLKVAREIEARQLETFCGVPSTFHGLAEFHRLKPLCMRSIKILCSAGAAMNRARFAEVKEIFPESLFFNNYGMTEAAPRISYVCETDPRFHEPTCGRPMDGVGVKVVHPETHQELPDGQFGVLAVKGPNITSGYLNDMELTRASFTRDGYLLSGDNAYLDKGYIFLNGRRDDIFNVSGEKVAPLEVERVLNEIPAVDMSAVTGAPDAQRGMQPIAFLKLNRPATRQEIVGYIQHKLVPIKLPQRYFEVADFPMTSNGKLRRRDLSLNDCRHVIREID